MREFSQTAADALRRGMEGFISQHGRAMTFMEVCGTHTVAIFRSGLRSLLPKGGVNLLSGPGCPVCVTDQGDIDMAIALARRKDFIIATYGDMMRVPGADGESLAKMKSGGARVEVVTSSMRSIEIAMGSPGCQVVFLGVGFETTAPATAAALKQARLKDLRNFSVLCLHKTVPPVMRSLCSNPELKIDGFVLPGNVIVVAGVQDYAFLTEELQKAAAVAGFEPEEILAALVDLSRQVATGGFKLSAYRFNDVPREGNTTARKLLSEVFEPCDAPWRGLGTIPGSGLRVSEAYSRFDAAKRYGLSPAGATEIEGCRCGKVLTGLITPPECELYADACTPLTPVGPCMVSSEGTCGAWYRFNGQ